MLCFLAFVFNLYITFKQAIFDGLNQKSITLKSELLDSLRTQDSAITARLSSTGSWTEKVTVGSLLSSSTLLNGFALQMAEKRALLVAALIDALNSLYVV